MRFSRWLYTTAAAAIAVLVILILYAVLYNVNGPYFRPEHLPPELLQVLHNLQVDDVEKIGINLRSGRGSWWASLDPSSDKADVERVLKAVHGIWYSDEQPRMSYKHGMDTLTIHTKHGQGPIVPQTIRIYGVFDPSKAPLITPQMRSNELSNVLWDIVKRKGRHYPPKKQ